MAPSADRLLIALVRRLQGIVGQDGIVDRLLHGVQLILGQHRAVGKVKTQTIGRHQRTGLLDVLAQNIAQLAVEQVGGGVVAGDIHAALGIDDGPDRILHPRPALVTGPTWTISPAPAAAYL